MSGDRWGVSMLEIQQHFKRTSEMEAVLRVSLLVMQAVDKLDITVELQPSIQGYPCFTDFAFIFKNSDYSISFVQN